MDLFGLGAFLTLGDLELDARTVVERLVTVHINRGEVDEDVLTTVDRDEAVALLAVEPLDSALCHCALPHSAVPASRSRPVQPPCRNSAVPGWNWREEVTDIARYTSGSRTTSAQIGH